MAQASLSNNQSIPFKNIPSKGLTVRSSIQHAEPLKVSETLSFNQFKKQHNMSNKKGTDSVPLTERLPDKGDLTHSKMKADPDAGSEEDEESPERYLAGLKVYKEHIVSKPEFNPYGLRKEKTNSDLLPIADEAEQYASGQQSQDLPTGTNDILNEYAKKSKCGPNDV